MKKINQAAFGLIVSATLFAGSHALAQESDTMRYNQYGVRVNRLPLMVEERNGILVFESKDQSHRVWYDVRVQADGAMFYGDTYNPIGNGVSIRRARFAVKTEFLNNWYAELDMDIANSELELKDAYLLRWFGDNLNVRIGNFKENFSLESTTTSRYLTFMERPMAVSTFAPSRHIGISTHYSKNWFLIMGGVHFQAIDDIEKRSLSIDNNKDYGMDEGYSYTGKLVLMPLYKDKAKGLHLGLSGSYRTPKTDTESPGTLRYSIRSLTDINRKKYLDTDRITNLKNNILSGLEFAAYSNNLRFQTEYLMSDVYRNEGLEKLRFDGWYVFGSWILFGGNYNYNTREAEFTQVKRGKTWGDIEVALRYDYLSLNSSKETLMGGAGEGITFGLNFYANNNVKIMLNYSYLNHDRYANGKNKLFVGYDANGQLTHDPKLVASPDGEAGEDFHMIGIRFEVDF